MTDTLTLIRCKPGRVLAKRFMAPGQDPEAYDAGALFRVEEIQVEDLDDLAETIDAIRTDPTLALVRGAVHPDVAQGLDEGEWVRRLRHAREDADAAFQAHPHRWLILDLDNGPDVEPGPAGLAGAVDRWIRQAPAWLRGAALVFFPSARAAPFEALRGRVVVWCDGLVSDEQAAECARDAGCDPSVAQAVAVNYTADPLFADGVTDPLASRAPVRLPGGLVRVRDLPRPPARGEAKDRDRPDGRPLTEAELEAAAEALAEVVVPGARNAIAVAFGAYCGARGVSEEDASAIVEAGMAEVSDDVPGRVRDCRRGWHHSTGGPAGLRTAVGSEGLARLDRAVPDFRDDALATAAVERAAKRAQERRDRVARALERDGVIRAEDPPIVSLRSAPKFFVRKDEDDPVYYPPVCATLLRAQLLAAGLEHLTVDHKGKRIGQDEIVEIATLADDHECDFRATSNTWDATRRVMIQGYQMAAIEPVHDPAVDALFRVSYDNGVGGLEAFLEWVAATHQRWIDRPAAALVLVGARSTFKSGLAIPLAMQWGRDEPVSLEAAAVQFNGTITRCPIVLDDEAKALSAGKLTSKEILNRIQARARDFEPKGIERGVLRGCTRDLYTMNDLTGFRLGDVEGVATIDALEGRLAIHETHDRTEEIRAALDALRISGTDDVDMGRVAAHVRWVQENVTPTPQRFLGAYLSEASTRVAMAGVMARDAALWDHVGHWLEAGGAEAGGLAVRDGTLYAYPAALAGHLNTQHGPRWDLERVQRALSTVRTGDRKMLRFAGGGRGWCWPIDARRLALALRWSVTDVADRLDSGKRVGRFWGVS